MQCLKKAVPHHGGPCWSVCRKPDIVGRSCWTVISQPLPNVTQPHTHTHTHTTTAAQSTLWGSFQTYHRTITFNRPRHTHSFHSTGLPFRS